MYTMVKLNDHIVRAIAKCIQHGVPYTVLPNGAIKIHRKRIANKRSNKGLTRCNTWDSLAVRARVCHGFKGEGLRNVN
jgi:hypothetical protein